MGKRTRARPGSVARTHHDNALRVRRQHNALSLRQLICGLGAAPPRARSGHRRRSGILLLRVGGAVRAAPRRVWSHRRAFSDAATICSSSEPCSARAGSGVTSPSGRRHIRSSSAHRAGGGGRAGQCARGRAAPAERCRRGRLSNITNYCRPRFCRTGIRLLCRWLAQFQQALGLPLSQAHH